MFNPPFSGSMLIYSALGLLTIGMALFMVFIVRRVLRILRRVGRKPVKRLGVIASTLRLLLILLLIAVSLAFLFLGAFIQSYTAFTHREFAATIYCTPVPGTEDTMILELVTRESPTAAHSRRYRLRGQQWTVEGHILKWARTLPSGR